MEAKQHVIIILALTALCVDTSMARYVERDNRSPMLTMFDGMQQLMTGQKFFNRMYFRKIQTCMNMLDPNLVEAQEKGWQGIVDYWNMQKSRKATSRRLVKEPCNYASSIALYRTVMEVCNRKTQGAPFNMPDSDVNTISTLMADLAYVTAFLHGTRTKSSEQHDMEVMQAFLTASYEALVRYLPTRDPVIKYLSYYPKSLNSARIKNARMAMYLTQPVQNWTPVSTSSDVSKRGLLMASITATIALLANPKNFRRFYPTVLRTFESDISREDKEFFIKDFLPALMKTTSYIRAKPRDSEKLFKNLRSFIGKAFHVFPWSENEIDAPIMSLQKQRAADVPLAKDLVSNNELSNFKFFDQDLLRGVNIYPGQKWCGSVSLHSKFHIRSAVGIIDLIYLIDEAVGLIKKSS